MDIVKQLAMHGHSPDATISEKRPKKRPSSSKEDKKSVKRRKAQPESTHTVHELKDEPAVQIGSEIPEKAEVARTDLITKRKKTHHDREDGTSSSKHTQAGQSVKGKRKSKKQNAREVASLKTSPEAATTTAEVPANGGSRPSSEGAGLDPAAEEAQESMQGKAQRFICFIGTLPPPQICMLVLLRRSSPNSFHRQPTIHNYIRLLNFSLLLHFSRLSPTHHRQNRPQKIQRLCLPRVRPLRQDEDVSQALPPLQLLRRSITSQENQCATDGGWRRLKKRREEGEVAS